ncbi:SigE family RNA polymerase sigma factor [Motilibacter aurantiacus]|uniref:SigE family RNA polymerase sigma factor n=1 Tax=Motilibacter aurantiacus TaxID=2714955 RepID=UPI00140938B2|nr:SigE family RNA polymerase sigma factor [Motilibacter aurantiacus]NHC44198.1 SigE family RNA polymerase sigma factor [Motilibacter aurantiacus]
MEFEEYVAARGQHLLRLAMLLADDAHAAEDLVQTALLDAYRHWRRVRKAGAPDAYVRRILVNAALASRRRRSSTELVVAEVRPVASVPDHAEATVAQDAAWRAIAALPPRSRAVLALRYFEDLDDEAVADALGITRSTVRSTAARALASLRSQVTAPLPGGER